MGQKHSYLQTMKTWIALAFLCLVGTAVATNEKDSACTICTQLVTLVEDYVTGGKTEDQAKEFAFKLCDALPYPLKDCKRVSGKVVEFVYKNATPAQICTDLKIC